MRKLLMGSIVIVFVIAIGFEILLFISPLGQYPNLEKAIQSAGVFVALLAALMAVWVAFPESKKVSVEVIPYIDTNADSWKLVHNIQPKGSTSVYDSTVSITSYKVQFKIANRSDFDWVEPVITFRLPADKQHPDENMEKQKFHSNLFNNPYEVRMLDMGDTKLLSNTVVPYLNNNEHVTLWVRMSFGNEEPFNVYVSVHCKNALGTTKKISIKPVELLRSSK